MHLRHRCRVAVLATLLLIGVGASATASAQTINFVNLDPVVGAGLQIGTARAELSNTTHGGVNVHIESSDSTIARVSPNNSIAGTPAIDVFVPNGTDDAFFWVQGLEDTIGTVEIIATAPGFAPETTMVSVAQPAVSIVSLVSSRDAFGTNTNFLVRIGLPSGNGVNPQQQVRAGSDGQLVTITNSIAGVAQLVTLPDTGQTVTLTLDPGMQQSSGTVNAGGVAFDPIAVGVTTVTASIPGFISTPDASREVTVTQPYINASAVVDVGAGLFDGDSFFLSGGQHGGVTVHIESSDSNLVLVSQHPDSVGRESVDIFIPDGSGTTANTYYVHGKDGATGTATLTYTAPGFTQDQELSSVVQPYVIFYSLNTTIDVLDPLSSVRVRVGIPNAGMTSVGTAQQRRPGTPPLVATITSSDPSVAHFLTLADTSGTVTTEIVPGQSISPSSVALGGVGMDGLSAGTTTATTTIPGFVTPVNGMKLVTVNQPELILGTIEDVGAGLRTGAEFINLSASQHGGVTVTLTSLNPDLALLSATAGATVGTPSIQLVFPNGDASESFYVHGLEDTTGTAVIVASEPMFFAPDTNTVDVVTPGISISALASTFDTLDPTEDFTVRVGVPHVSMNYIGDVQDVRPGSGGVLATVSSSDSLVAEVLTLADSGGTVTILVPENDDSTPNSVGAGGVGVDGLSPGMTTISVTANGFISLTNASQEVTVTSPTMSLSVTDVGSGLQEDLRNGFLSASGHPGVIVTVASLDTTLSLVAPDQSTPGSASIDVFVPGGTTSFGYVLQALEDTTGATGIAVSAPFFAPDTAYFDVVQPGIRLLGLQSSIDVTDALDSFYGVVGKPNVGNTDVSSTNYQKARVGGPGIPVTFVTSDSSVSRLETSGSNGGTIQLTILPGADRTPTSYATDGVAHNGLGEGSTVISASAPGFISVATAFETVFISDDNLYLLGLPLDVGSGLQTGALTAQFGKALHGGVTLHIESSDSSLARISTVSGVPGDPFVDIVVPNGTDQVNYFIHGQAGTTGEALITGTAAGFPTAVETVTVVVPMVAILSLADTIDVADPSDEFIVQIGVPNAGGTAIATPQRAGSGSPLDLTVMTSDAGIGLLETLTDTSSTILMQIAAGESQTQGTVAAGGIAFFPGGPGSVTVTPSIPGFISLANVVQVTGAAVSADPSLPVQLALSQNFPNPASSATTIGFALPTAGPVQLHVFDVKGRRVKTLVSGEMPAGVHQVRWDGVSDGGARVGAGVYFYRLTVGTQFLTRRLVLLR